jgi:hypothetical protein
VTRTFGCAALIAAVMVGAGCGDGDDGTGADGGRRDAAARDAQPVDAAPIDAEPVEDAGADAEPLDAQPLDAQPLDAQPLDAETLRDAETAPDADTAPDAGSAADAGPATTTDAGRPSDAGIAPVDAGRDAGPAVAIDGGRDSGPAIDAGRDAGPGPMIDAGRDSGPAVVDAGARDAGATDAGDSPSARIDRVRSAAPGVLPMPIHIDTVQVTYVLQPVGDDPGGVFVQSDLLGPALFVAIDPDELSATPIVRGVYASFSVTETAIVAGQHRVTAILPGSFGAGTTPVGGVVAEPQDITTVDVPSMLGAIESEITTNRMTVTGGFEECGLDHYCAPITTTGVPTARTTYRFRTVQSVIEALGLQRGCYQDVQVTPLWRNGTTAQSAAWVTSDIAATACPNPRPVGAVALGPTTVAVVFDAPMAASTVAAADFTFTGGVTAVSATTSGYVVVITTTAMLPGSMHSVTIGAMRDVTMVDTIAGDTETFVVPAATGRPNAAGQIVITEIMASPSGSTETGREWIELYNPSSTQTHSLTGCELHDATASSHTLGTLTIAPGDHVVLASGTDPGFTEDYAYSGFTLNNSGAESVVLECDGVEIARVDLDDTFASRDGHALSIDPDLRNAFLDDEPTSWCSAITGYGAAGDFGTPGAANPECR